MTRFVLPLAFALSALLLLVGCGIDALNNDEGSTNSTGASGTIENDFLATLADAEAAVTAFEQSEDVGADAGAYHQRVGDDLDHLRSLWNDMREQCDGLGECPVGGGLTGDWDGTCMTDGHMMGATDMSELRDRIETAHGELNDYWIQCGDDPGSEACVERHAEHVGRMIGTIRGLDGECRDLWSGESEQHGQCGMMDDDHGGMMDGDHGGMMDGDHGGMMD